MTKIKSHLLELSAPSKEVMLMKITKKRFIELRENGIEREAFEDLSSKLEIHTIFSTSTFKKDGYGVDLYLDGKSVSGFDQHFKSLFDAKAPDVDPEVVLHTTKSNRTTYYIYWERFFKGNRHQLRFKDDFALEKVSLFFPSDVQVGDQTLSGFEVMYDGNDFEEVSVDFSGDELYLIDSLGEKFDFEIYD